MKHLKLLMLLFAVGFGSMVYGQNEEKAKVYIIRNIPLNALIASPIMINQSTVGVTMGMTYLEQYVDPGNIEITSTGRSSKTLHLNVEAGNTYYIQQKVNMPMPGVIISKFQEFKPGKGENALRKCRPARTGASTM